MRHAVVSVPVQAVTAASSFSSEGAVLVLRHLLDGEEGGVVVDRREVRAAQLGAGGRYEGGRVEMDATQAVDGWMLLERGAEELWMEVECRGCQQAGIRLATDWMEEDEEVVEVEADVGVAATEVRRFKRSLRQADESDDVTNMLMSAKHHGEKKRRRRQRRRRRIECPQSPPSSRGGGRTRKPRCCRSPKELVFSDFGDAFQFLLKPHTMEVGMCGGRCPAKFAAKNAHAMLQSLLHLQSRKRRRKSERRRGEHADEDKVPAPCCVPTKLSPRPVLHLTSDGDAEVTWWRNVVADECGCS